MVTKRHKVIDQICFLWPNGDVGTLIANLLMIIFLKLVMKSWRRKKYKWLLEIIKTIWIKFERNF